MIDMTDERAAEVLAAHNEWRRHNGETGEPGAPAMGDPAELGRAIDHAVDRLRSHPPAEAQAQGEAVVWLNPYCEFGEPFSNVQTKRHTVPLYAAPPRAPVGVDVDQLRKQATAWEAVFDVLEEVAPGWRDGEVRTTTHKAIQTIRALAQQSATVDGVAEVQQLRAENHRLMMVCQSAHDRLLRGDEDAEVLALLEDAWTGPAETEANLAREAGSA